MSKALNSIANICWNIVRFYSFHLFFRSPNYPAKYDGPGKGLASRACNWYLSARNGYKILMHFEFFHVEGDPEGDFDLRVFYKIWLNTHFCHI